jgi:predicted ribosomally synthesized peptide with SipW-like signal peptide
MEPYMKKSLLLSAFSVAGAAALVGGMTYASFNDYEDVDLPTVAAGTLELDLDGPITSSVDIPSDWEPGETLDLTIPLENTGTIDGHVWVQVLGFYGIEDGCQVVPGHSVENGIDTDCWNLFSGGDLAQYLDLSMADGWGTAFGDLDLSGDPLDLGPLPAGSGSDFVLHLTFANVDAYDDDGNLKIFDHSSQNDAQGDKVKVFLKFGLTQWSLPDTVTPAA